MMNQNKFKNNNMKKSIKSTFCKFGLMLFLAMFTIAGKAQVAGGQYAMSISSVSATTNTIDVSLTIAVNSPAEGMRFGGFSTSINFNTAIINGGTISAAYVAGTRSNALSALPSNAVNVATAGTIRLTTATLSPGVDILPGTTLNLGTWRITNTNAWATANANLWLQNLLVSGKTNSAVVGQPVGVSSGSSFTYTTTAGNPAPGVVLSHSSAAPYSLSVGQICATAASQTASAAVSCFGYTNGSSTITLSPVPTHTSVSYTVDGGSVQTATLTSGSFTITGLSAGTHAVVISDSGCGNVSATGVSVGTPNQLTNSTTASACDSYVWSVNGQTYSASGTYTATNTSGACPVAETLNLTITPSSNHTTDVTACDTYTWSNNGQTYTTSGVYTGTTTNCVTEKLNLTITPSSNHTTNITACDSYTWSNNGQTYTTSGVYTGTTANCVTEKLNLTITPSSNHTTNITACGTYTWSNNGQTYTTSGVYTGTTANCVTEKLNLTITPETSNTTTASACNTYHWGVNDVDYTESGTYTDVRNCHTEILELTITPSTSHTTSINACGSYTWSNNGQTYTTSGIYTGTTSNCETQVLNLTITPNTTNTTTATACGSYTWSVNSQTYTTSGVYSVVSGCNTELLDLTINSATITVQPAGNFICSTAGSTSSFSVESNVTGASYTWEYRVVTAANPNPAWITISAANASTIYSNYTSATLNILKTATLPAAGTEYRVTVSGACGTATSNSAALLVISTVKAGTIASATTVCLGSDITLTLTKYAATSFQWQSAIGATGVFADIPGATGTSYTIEGATADMNKSYRVVVFNSCNNTTATSAIRTLKVDPTSVAGTVTGGGVVCAGSNGSLKVAGYVGKIQWEYSTDGISYANAPAAAAGQTVPFGTSSTNSTAATYVVTGITTGVYFRAKLTSGTCSSAYTEPVQYTIGTAASVGTISAASTTLCPATGTTLTLTGATGVITWEKATNLTTPVWTAIANSNVLSISTGNLAASTAYRAKVTIGLCSTVISNTVVVTVVAKPVAKPLVTNTTSPTGATALTAICTNSTTPKTLTIGAGYVGLIEWQVSTTSATTGFTTIAGETGATYTITNPVAGANYYRVRMYNTCGVEVLGAVKAVYYKDCGAPAKGVIAAPFGVVAYPNPYTENFNLSLTTSSDATVSVSIYDMTGKLIDKREVAPTEVSGLQVGGRYPSGVYNVVVTQGSDVKTLRVIKR